MTHHVSYLVNDEKVIVMGNEGTIQAVGTWADVKNMSCVAKMSLSSDAIDEEGDSGPKAVPVWRDSPWAFQTYKPECNSDQKNLEMCSTYGIFFKILIEYYFSFRLGLKGYILSGILSFTHGFICMAVPTYIAFFVMSGTKLSKEGLWLLGIVGLGFAHSCICFCFYRTFFYFAVKGNTMLHDKMVDAMVRAPMAFFDNNPTGRILNRFTKDIAIIDHIIITLALSIENEATLLFATFVISCVANHYIIPSAAFVFVISCWLLMNILLPGMNRLRIMEANCMSCIIGAMIESVEGIVTLRAFNAQDFLIFVFQRYLVDYSTVVKVSIEFENWLLLRITCLRILFIAAVILGSVTILQSGFFLNKAILSVVILIFRRILVAVNFLLSVIIDFGYRSISLEQVMEYSKIKPEPAWHSPEGKGPPDNWPSNGKISVVNLWARYATSLPFVLRGMSFEIYPGMFVGIVGRSGSGKSSLVKALFRILEYDSSCGYIEIDGIKTCDVGLHELRSRMSIVSQEPLLFANTIRYNIDPNREASDVEIWKALEMVHFKECINDLDTEISENCAIFSSGQKQLLGFARALVKMSAIYVMDEATAFIDGEMDSLVSARVHDLLKNATVLMVAHRLHTIIGTERVLVVESGEIVEYGSPHELLKDGNGVFTKMVVNTGAHEQLKRTAQEGLVASSIPPNVNGM